MERELEILALSEMKRHNKEQEKRCCHNCFECMGIGFNGVNCPHKQYDNLDDFLEYLKNN